MKENTIKVLRTIENICSALTLISLAALPVAEIVVRVFFKTGIPGSPLILSHLILLIGLISGMITTREKEHLSITLIQYLPNKKLKQLLTDTANGIAAFMTTIFAWGSASFVTLGLTPWRMIGFIPDQILGLILPIGYTVMAIRFAFNIKMGGKNRLVPLLVLIAGCFFSLPVIAKVFWGFEAPAAIGNMVEQINAVVTAISLPACLLLIASAFIGTPLFVVLGGISLVLLQASGGELDIVANQSYTLLTQSSMAAIPLFTLTGFFLSESKAGERLVHAFRNLFGWIPGGMIIATVIVCAFFTTFTGASGVTILALGGILSTILIDNGKYPKRFTIGLLTAVGSIGLLFPPSLPIILVGSMTQTNILHLFAGGLIPGILLVGSMIVFGVFAALKNHIPVEKFNLKETAASIKGSVWELLLPVWLVIGNFSGMLSIIETGAVAVLYCFIIEVFVNKDIELRDVLKVFTKAAPIIGGVLSILALSQALSYYIIDTQVPEKLTTWVQTVVESKYVFLLLLNLFLIVVGCLMDIFSAITVVLPLIAPLGVAFGIDPVHLGIIFVVNMEVGFLTPPVGLNLFLAAYRFEQPFVEICRAVMPFLLIQLIVVLLVTYIPFLTTALIPLLG